MAGRTTELLAFIAVVLLGCGREVAAPAPLPEIPDASKALAADLETVRGARVLFVHDSLGAQVLEGLARIGGSELRLEAFDAPADAEVAIDAFEKASGASPTPDVALLELSFSQVTPETTGKELFTRYRRCVARLRRAHPELSLVHVTLPLVARETAALGLIRELTGASSARSQANALRDDYDGRVRAAFRGEPILDLARVESLVGEPGALSREGEDRAARALIAAVASALRTRGSHPG